MRALKGSDARIIESSRISCQGQENLNKAMQLSGCFALYILENNRRGRARNKLHVTVFLLFLLSFQILAAISVSTGCVSYGICMAYTSSAIPSMLAPNNSLTIEIGTYETTWMSKQLS